MPRPGTTLINASTGVIGEIRSAMATLAQFQAQFGTEWVLADGTTAAGTKYNAMTGNANLPDLRGVVLRGKNNGRADGSQDPAGDLALGTFQNDQIQGHYHNQYYGSSNYGNAAGWGNLSANENKPNSVPGQLSVRDAASDGTNGTPRTGAESRAKGVVVNHFIKVN